MFFSSNSNFTKGLTWVYLPYALFCDIAFLFEPIVLLYIIFIVIVYKDIFTLTSAFSVMTFYMAMNIMAEETVSFRSRLKLLLLSPSIYFLFYILSFVEYVALIKSLSNMPKLKKSINASKYTWEPVKRIGYFLSPSL
jgi:hypothetical protein